MTMNNIWCVGRNYKAHALELNNPLPDRPLIFLKAGSTAVLTTSFALPEGLGEIHHECEIAVRVNGQGEPTHLGLALDLTARDEQTRLKKKGEPWTLAKSFKQACPLSPFVPFQNFLHFQGLEFQLHKNGQLVQRGFARDMIFSLQELLSYISRHFPLSDGDIILTGTPEGVGPVKNGDQLHAEIIGLLSVTWAVKAESP